MKKGGSVGPRGMEKPCSDGGFPTMGPIIIPSKPGSIIPYSNQSTKVFSMAQLTVIYGIVMIYNLSFKSYNPIYDC